MKVPRYSKDELRKKMLPVLSAGQAVRMPRWDVKVFLDGVCCLTITEDNVSGLDDLNEGDLKAIEICGKQLLGFIGKAT